jgi:hypothetical protein
MEPIKAPIGQGVIIEQSHLPQVAALKRVFEL